MRSGQPLPDEGVTIMNSPRWRFAPAAWGLITLITGLILLGGPLLADIGLSHPESCKDADDDYLAVL